MVQFAEGGYNAKEHAELLDELYGEQDPNVIELVVGIDDDAIKFEKPAEEPEEK
jgi:hypothetical protein